MLVDAHAHLGVANRADRASGRLVAIAYLLLQYLLAAVLLAAATLKTQGAVVILLRHHRGPGPDDLLNIGAAAGEVVLAFWAVVGVWPRAWWAASVCCFLLFAGVSASRVAAGQSSCGCFGPLEVDPAYALVFDVAAVMGLVVLGWQVYWRTPTNSRPTGRGPTRHPSALVAVACCVAVVILTGVGTPAIRAALATGRAKQADGAGEPGESPISWVGKPLPLMSAVDIRDRLDVGRWVVVLYRSNCPACVGELRRYEVLAADLASASDPSQVAVIELPPYAAPADSPVPRDTRCVRGRLIDPNAWPYTTPTAFVIEDGVVRYLAVNEKG